MRTLLAMLLAALALPAGGFALKIGDDRDPPALVRKSNDPLVRMVVMNFSSPVHEEITYRTFGCALFDKACRTGLEDEGITMASVLKGIRWPDNPTYRMNLGPLMPLCMGDIKLGYKALPECWLASFARASAASSIGLSVDPRHPGLPFTLLARSHFGDLQFLHAMAPPGMEAATTRERIVTWLHFLYEVSLGRIEPGKDVAKVAIVAPLFPGSGWSVAFLLDNTKDAKALKGVALGALLHTVQDSFATCHATRRRNGDGLMEIVQFMSYGGQDADAHGRHDAKPEWDEGGANPIVFGRALLELRRARRDWSDGPRQLVDSYFTVAGDATTASPGRCAMPDPIGNSPPPGG